MLQDDLKKIRARPDEAQNIAIFSHVSPDGDSVGSCLALGWALEDEGKNVQYISEDEIPEKYTFLFASTADGENPFVKEPVNADCYVVPDMSSLDRAGRYFLDRPELAPDVCIDHHVSNTGVAKLNWVEPDSPAACAVLAGIMPKMGYRLTKRISAALLCGIISDTNSFTNVSVNAASLHAAADLADNGVEIYPVSYQCYTEHTMEEMAYWKQAMKNLHIEDGIAWSVMRTKDMEEAGCTTEDDGRFVNYMVNTRGVHVAILFTEVGADKMRISLRSDAGYDVAKVAVALGGGGHKNASGATVYGPIDEQIRLVLQKTRTIAF